MKHYAFLVDGSADSSVKSFLEGNRSLEEFQKVVLSEDHVIVVWTYNYYRKLFDYIL